MKKGLKALAVVPVAVLLLVGCEEPYDYGALEGRIGALETEVTTIGDEFSTFREEWGGFYEDWGTYREEIGLAPVGEEPLEEEGVGK